MPVLSPAQYWHRIESGKIHLGQNEVESALGPLPAARAAKLRGWGRHKHAEQNLCCPPHLQNTWDRYHRQFQSMERPDTNELDTGILRRTRVLTTPGRAPDAGRALERLSKDLRQRLCKVNANLKQYREETARTSSGTQRLNMRSVSIISVGSDDDELPEDSLLKGRTRFMTAIRAKYVANQHMGRMLPRTLRYLRECSDMQLDYPERHLHDWEYLEHRLNSSSLQFYLMVLQRMRSAWLPGLSYLITWACENRVFSQLALNQEVARSVAF